MALPVISVDLVARIAKFESEMKRAATVQQQQFKLMENAANAAKVAFAGLIGAFSVNTLVQFVRSTLDVADALEKTAQKTGATVEFLSAMQYGASLAGVNVEELNKALVKLNVNLTEAQGGAKEQAEAFKALKLDPTQLRSSEEALLAIADRFSKIEDSAGKTAIAVKLFGRSGADLIPFLNAGKEGFEEFSKEAERLGVVLDSKTTKAAERFNDEMTRFGAGIRGAGISIVKEMIGPLQNMVDVLNAASKAAGGFAAGLKVLLTIDPFKNTAEELKSISKEIEILDRRIASSRSFGTSEITKREQDDRDKARRQDLVNLRKYYDERQRVQQEYEKKGADALLKGLGGESKFLAPPGSAKERLAMPTDDAAIKKARDEEFKAIESRIEAQNKLNAQNNAFADAEEKRAAHQIELQVENLKRISDYKEVYRRAEEEEERKADEQEFDNAISLQKRISDYKNSVLESENEEILKKSKEMSDAAALIGYSFASAFEDAALAGKSFADVMKGLLQDIARIILHMTVTKPVGEATGNILAKVLGNIFGGLGGATVSDSGGRRRAGEPLWIGTGAQPELFVPETAGAMYPAGRGSNSGGGLVVNVDARGADAGVDARIRMAVPSIMQAVKASTQDDKRRRRIQ